MINDIFFIGADGPQWTELKSRFPTARRAVSVKKAQQNSLTKMLWIVWDDVKIRNDFDFTYQADEWSKDYVHVFRNGEHFDGILLCSKRLQLSQNEIDHRFFVSKKEVDIIASTPIPYDKFVINTYDDYLAAAADSKTEMFWAIWPDVVVADDFDFSLYFSHHNSYDRRQTHSFLNGEYKDGIMLCSKHTFLGRKEIEHRFAINKKEHDVVASVPAKYDTFYVDTYDDYLIALESTKTEMFWIVWPEVNIASDFNFDVYFSHHNSYDRKQNHSFLNGEYKDGIMLCSVHAPLGTREIEHRFAINKKEHDIVASSPKPYDKFMVGSYNDYLDALTLSSTEMFWIVWPDVDVLSSFKFDWYYPRYNVQDRRQNHIFRNGEYQDGIMLCSKHVPISKREIEYKFVVNKNAIDVLASKPKPFDVVFISYQEPTADSNFAELLKKAPNAKRVHGVKGIHQAHKKAAELCSTEMFWVVDGDAKLEKEFEFEYQVPRWEHDCVHVWRSCNPINNLEYGYGGVKLLPRKLTAAVDINATDMTTSISNKFKAVPEVSNITEFNTDAFSTWRSAFRECAKLASNIIRGQIDDESESRLETWCTVGRDSTFGDYAIRGAISGREFGTTNKSSAELGKINDYEWLKAKFNDECE